MLGYLLMIRLLYLYLNNKVKSKILGHVDFDGDGEADSIMFDTNGDGEVDTIVLNSDLEE